MKQVLAWAHRHSRLLLTLLSAAVIVILLGVNILAAYIEQDKTLYIDLTPEGLYTLTDDMKETCAQLQGDITITFCSDPDALMSDYLCRYVYVMAMELANRFDRIQVETYNIAQNPTAVNRFRATSATQILRDDVIVSCGGRYRILSASSFWTLSESAVDTTDYYSFNGEYKMATAFLAITSVVEPVVCFTYGHGEHIYVDPADTENADLLPLSDPDRSGFYSLMRDSGLAVKYINLDEEDIPADCVLVVMDGPTSDYTVGNPNSISEVTGLKRLHSFLAADYGAMMLFKDPDVTLQNVEDFSEDWGIAYDNDIYIRDDAQHTLSDADNTRQKLIVTLSKDEDSVANAVYSEIAGLATSPRTIAENSGAVHKSWLSDSVGSSSLVNVMSYYFDFFTTSPAALAFTLDGRQDQPSEDAQTYALAGISLRMRHDTVKNEGYYSYYFGAATTELTSNTYIENSAYCNYDIMFSLVRYISRTDAYASMSLGGTSLNSDRLGGKPLLTVKISESGNVRYDKNGEVAKTYVILTQSTSVAWMVVMVLTPVVLAAAVGTVILVRRKNR